MLDYNVQEVESEETNPTGIAKFGENETLNNQMKEIIHDKSDLEMKHPIRLLDENEGVYSKPYRRSMQENEFIDGEVKRMLDEGIIAEGSGKYASPAILVRKKDVSLRFCVDYRKLNRLTVVEPHPIPITDELLETIAPARVFSALDLESGYHQV